MATLTTAMREAIEGSADMFLFARFHTPLNNVPAVAMRHAERFEKHLKAMRAMSLSLSTEIQDTASQKILAQTLDVAMEQNRVLFDLLECMAVAADQMDYSWKILDRIVPQGRPWFLVSKQNVEQDLQDWLQDLSWLVVPCAPAMVFLVSDGSDTSVTLFKLRWSHIIEREGH